MLFTCKQTSFNLQSNDKAHVYSVTQSCPTLCDPMDCSPARLLCPWDFSGRNTEVGCHFLLQEIFPTQGSNPHTLHWQVGSSPESSWKPNDKVKTTKNNNSTVGMDLKWLQQQLLYKKTRRVPMHTSLLQEGALLCPKYSFI